MDMTLFTLANEALIVKVSSMGGTIEALYGCHHGRQIPLLRPGAATGNAGQSSCFPLVPFGNRITGNSFSFEGETYTLTPNTEWDPHYLHGDGWLNPWICREQSEERLVLAYQHRSEIYSYTVCQCFELQGSSLVVSLDVTNQGEVALPFGLGWHPYFPLTGQTTLQAKAGGYWLEDQQWLAGEHQTLLPAELDFNQPALLPRRWINNGFSQWDGRAQIHWPEHRWSLTMTTEPAAPCYFVFVSDPCFDEGYQFDYFCVEPMSHAANAHNLTQGGGLKRLAPGETLHQTMRLISQPEV